MSNPWAQAYEDLRKPYLEGKMAKKDYDGDGKIESGTDEYMGSRDKAIKKAMAEKGKKKVSEHHRKDAEGNVIPHEEEGDGTPSSVEEEQINELSKKTLGGYIKKASKETRGNMVATQHGSGIPKKARDIKLKQVNKRLKGMEKAGEKLAKEETLDEISMPKNTSYEKMSYKKLKNTHGDFKNMDSKPPRVAVLDKKTGGTVSKPVKFVPDKKPKSKMKEEFDHIENCPLAEAILGTLHVADMAGNTLAWQNRMNTNDKGERLYDFGQDLINAMAEYVDEAKVDKMVPDHKRSAKRLERYGNPHGSHALGGGIQRDRRADHAERRGKKTKGMKKENWRAELEYIEEISPSGEPLKTMKKNEKVDGKEGSVNNKITINPEVQVESNEINENPLAVGAALGIAGAGGYLINKMRKNAQNKKPGTLGGELQMKKDATNAAMQNMSYEPEGDMVEGKMEGGYISNAAKAEVRNLRRFGKKGSATPTGTFGQGTSEKAKLAVKRGEEHKARRGVKKKDMVEDAKMGRMTDDDLSKAHKKFSGMDQTSPANKFMMKRISKEMNKRKKKVNEDQINELSKKTLADYTRKSATSLAKHSMDFGGKPNKKSSKKLEKRHAGIMRAASKLANESLLDQVANAYVDEATRMKKEMGYNKGGTKKPMGPKAKDAALDAIKAKYKGQMMRSGSNQPKKVKGAKPSGGGKFKMMADKKKQTAADAKKRGFKNTQDYANTMARYGGKDNYDKGKGLGS